MPTGLWSALVQLFGNPHNVNLASLIAGAFAGLYGYQFLGKGGKVVQQIFVAAPASLAYGIFFYVIDSQTSFAYSSMIQSLLPLPQALHAWKLFPIFGAAVAFLHGMINPNLFRFHEKRVSHVRQIAAGVLQLIEFGGVLLIGLSVNIARLSWLAGMQLPFPRLPLLICLSIVAGCCWAYLAVLPVNPLRDRVGRWIVSGWDGATHTLGARAALLLRTLIASVIALLLFVLFLVGYPVAFFAYAIVVMGWVFIYPYLLYLVFGLATLYFQQEVDTKSEPSQFFLYLSFACFVVAVLLQIYQAVRFSGS